MNHEGGRDLVMWEMPQRLQGGNNVKMFQNTDFSHSSFVSVMNICKCCPWWSWEKKEKVQGSDGSPLPSLTCPVICNHHLRGFHHRGVQSAYRTSESHFNTSAGYCHGLKMLAPWDPGDTASLGKKKSQGWAFCSGPYLLCTCVCHCLYPSLECSLPGRWLCLQLPLHTKQCNDEVDWETSAENNLPLGTDVKEGHALCGREVKGKGFLRNCGLDRLREVWPWGTIPKELEG